jgi:hypothetical protein
MTASAQSVSIALQGNTFKVVGWSAPAAPPAAGWSSIFSVYAGPARDVPPMLGSYAVEQGSLVFHPRYPVAPGVRYRAVFHPPGGTVVERMLDGPALSTARTTRVERVYPTTDVLPSNTLRLYIYFSAPMSRGEAAARVHVLDSAGKELRNIFLPGEELWDPNNQRLTMTFDPGRIKRGLTSNETIGPPIVDGHRYTLVVDAAFRDARGVGLVQGFRKTFRGGPAVRVAPDPKDWRVRPPMAGTSGPLVVDFDRPMNYTLLQRTLSVAGPNGRLAGSVSVARAESEWRFTPARAWAPGAYQLIVDTSLEDLAANKIDQPFDIDVFNHVSEHLTTQTVSVPFEVRADVIQPPAPGRGRGRD